MKRNIQSGDWLILFLFLSLTVFGCGGSGGGSNSDGNDDTTAPTVNSITPADGETGVALNTNLSVTFSEACDAASLTASTFILSDGSGLVTGTISISGDTVTFNPDSALIKNTTYIATVSTGVTDLAGNHMGSNFTWRFTIDPEGIAMISMDEISYTGAFRFTNGNFGDSNVNYAVGALAFNPENHSLFIVGHAHQSAIAEYPVVAAGVQTTVAELPETGEPLQGFSKVLDTGGNPESIDRITGMLWLNGSLIVNAETWYDAAGDNVDTTLVIDDADNLSGPRDGYFELSGAAHSGGYMGAIPDHWQDAFNSKFYTGWSSVYSIVSRYSVGPSLWTFTPSDLLLGAADTNAQISATPFMNYAYREEHLSDRAVEYAAQGETGPFPPASPLWNILSRGVFGFFVPGTKTFAVIGSSGGINTGIGYKAVQDNGNQCGGPCPYGADDSYNYYWLFNVEDILAADNVYDPQPYEYGIWNVPFDEGGTHKVIGATLDPDNGTLYVALGKAGQMGDYDRPPLIITYSLP